MLGVRLPAEAEQMLEKHARTVGRGKSVIVREWIIERLERESIDERVRRAAAHLSESESQEDARFREEASAAWFRALDAEDGGYDWGAKGPPA